jgi:hypothetical protein
MKLQENVAKRIDIRTNTGSDTALDLSTTVIAQRTRFMSTSGITDGSGDFGFRR